MIPSTADDINETAESNITVTTDKYSYERGENVKILVEGSDWYNGSGSDLDFQYFIKDENGEIVKETYPVYTINCTERLFEGPKLLFWDQVYSTHKGWIWIPLSGESVPPGKYYAYFTLNHEGEYGPAEFEILDTPGYVHQRIRTNKSKYNVGEPIKITYKGIDSPYGPKTYLISITNGSERDSDVVFEFPIQFELAVWMPQYGEVEIIWNQTYQIYDDFYTDELVVPPSGDPVSPGKYYAWYGREGPPAEFEIIESSEEPIEPLFVTTDKYMYYQGEPIHITISGYRVGGSSQFSRGYIIKDEFGNWVRDAHHLTTLDVVISYGPDNSIWYQKYELMNEYDILGNHNIHHSKNGEQVLLGKYFVYPHPGNCEPAEIEIIEKIPKPVLIPEPVIDPSSSQLSDPLKQTDHNMDDNVQGNQNLEISKDSSQPIKTLMVIMVVFFSSMFLTYMEVRFTGRLLNRKLIK
jgi:hypothetical protein